MSNKFSHELYSIAERIGSVVLDRLNESDETKGELADRCAIAVDQAVRSVLLDQDGAWAGNSNQHTPGPWRPWHNGSQWVVSASVEDHPNWMREDFGGTCNVASAIARPANAHLVAAAPDLYAALAELVRLKDRRPDDYEARKPLAWEAARLALSAAGGPRPTRGGDET